MIKTIKLTLILILTTTFLSCGGTQQFKDISTSQPYKNLIGKNFKSIKQLHLSGVTEDRNYEKTIDRYVFTGPRGMGGPEVIQSTTVNPGITIKIQKALQCSNCWFGSPIVLLIAPNLPELNADAPIYLYRLRVEDQDGKVTLDPDYFTQIE